VPILLANLDKSTKKVGPKAPGWTPQGSVSKYLFAAVVASEDASYYSHDGLDYDELKAALKKDLEEGRFARGGSTITQQVIKNTYLSNEKTITRKIREMIWARAMSKVLTKREILAFYVNLVEFGPGLYGVRDASRLYFGKLPSDLTPKEAAFLVMLLPSPRRYSVSFRQKHLTPYARRRISQILLIMNKMGVLDDSAYASARGEALWGVDAGMDTVTEKDIEKGLGDGEDEAVSDGVTRAGTPRPSAAPAEAPEVPSEAPAEPAALGTSEGVPPAAPLESPAEGGVLSPSPTAP